MFCFLALALLKIGGDATFFNLQRRSGPMVDTPGAFFRGRV